jgi:hypothetical protein
MSVILAIVLFLISGSHAKYRNQGGPGYKTTNSAFKFDEITDCMTAKINFHGSPAVWENYCREVVKLYKKIGKLESIYLQKLDFEFEASSEQVFASKQAESSSNVDAPPPNYTEKMNQ